MLTAYAIPEKDDDGSDYSYVWTLIGNTLGDKDDKGTMDDADKQQLKLSNLKAGTLHMNWTKYLIPLSSLGQAMYEMGYFSPNSWLKQA